MSSINLIIGGASKSGTTALYEMLRQCPDFYLPQRKELHYFSRPYLEHTTAGPGDSAVLHEIPATINAYMSHFIDKSLDQVAVDVSPSYLFHYGSAIQIAHDLPSVKIVFLLRRPEDKVFSQYVHLVAEGRETLSFEEALKQEMVRKAKGYSDMWLYTESGYYSDAIAAFQDAMGTENVKVFLFEEFRHDPEFVIREICLYAGLDGLQIFDTDLESNVSGLPRSLLLARLIAPNNFTNLLRRVLPSNLGQYIRRILRSMNTGEKPKISTETRAHLSALYQDDIAKLENLIGRTTGWLPTSDQ
ncbi:sulfotransferase [Ascidiaceihabitans sp.]|nr:sulfotransferase [Ascidiaceihabitans sp.]